MAHLWKEHTDTWELTPLGADDMALAADTACAIIDANHESRGKDSAAVTLVRVPAVAEETWALLALAGTDVFVNALPVFGMRVLSHKDQIRIDRQTYYFSSEHLIRPEYFTGKPGTCCARCGDPIAANSLAVRCGCGLWFHQSENDGCWLYADCCCGCEVPATIDVDYKWLPEGL